MAEDRPVITVRPQGTHLTRQQLPKFEGISGTTTGSMHLCLHLVMIPPGGRAVPHFHNSYETALYIIRGRAETRYGPHLEHSSINEAGERRALRNSNAGLGCRRMKAHDLSSGTR